jgi:hypothetical protein
MIYDDLGVAIRDKSLDSEGNNDAQPMDQGLILGVVVGHLVVDLQDILQVITLGEMKRMPAPAPSRFREPSKYIFQCSGFSTGGGCWVSVHSEMKSTRI